MSLDPLVQVWREVLRPLNWQCWSHLSHADQARQRWHFIDSMRWIDAVQQPPIRPYHWRHAHRELLALKAASGHAAKEEPCAAV